MSSKADKFFPPKLVAVISATVVHRISHKLKLHQDTCTQKLHRGAIAKCLPAECVRRKGQRCDTGKIDMGTREQGNFGATVSGTCGFLAVPWPLIQRLYLSISRGKKIYRTTATSSTGLLQFQLVPGSVPRPSSLYAKVASRGVEVLFAPNATLSTAHPIPDFARCEHSASLVFNAKRTELFIFYKITWERVAIFWSSNAI